MREGILAVTVDAAQAQLTMHRVFDAFGIDADIEHAAVGQGDALIGPGVADQTVVALAVGRRRGIVLALGRCGTGEQHHAEQQQS